MLNESTDEPARTDEADGETSKPPSPEEIAAATAAIRATWTEDEYRVRYRGEMRGNPGPRAVARRSRWKPPTIRLSR